MKRVFSRNANNSIEEGFQVISAKKYESRERKRESQVHNSSV
jgi:hypothetical protein